MIPITSQSIGLIPLMAPRTRTLLCSCSWNGRRQCGITSYDHPRGKMPCKYFHWRMAQGMLRCRQLQTIAQQILKQSWRIALRPAGLRFLVRVRVDTVTTSSDARRCLSYCVHVLQHVVENALARLEDKSQNLPHATKCISCWPHTTADSKCPYAYCLSP